MSADRRRQAVHSVEIKSSAKKELLHIPISVRERIVDAIDSLAENPLAGSKRKGRYKHLRGLRVGEWRIIYEVRNDTRTVLVLHVAHRSKAYRRRTP